MRTVRDPAWRARMDTIAGRRAEYEQWLLAGDMRGWDLFAVAYRLPAWDRDHLDSPLPARRREAARHGWADWMNAAAIRELTQGEGGDPPAWQVSPANLEPCLVCGEPVPPTMLLCPSCGQATGGSDHDE